MTGRKRKGLRFWIALAVATAIVVVALLETVLRLLTQTEGGVERLFGQPLLPWPVVPPRLEEILALDPSACPYVMPHPELGWTIKPDGRHRTKPFVADAFGLRSLPSPIDATKKDGVTRILLVGDSFTHGDELGFEETWGARLEVLLGPSFQVLNGGVPGYGTDQAVLRLERELGPILKPDIVVLGIVRDDIPRNVNLFRVLYHHWTDLPWSKPRFVLDGEGLRLVNCPVVPREEVVATLRGFATSPLRTFDSCFRPEYYAEDGRFVSRTLRLLASQRAHRERYAFVEGLRKEGAEGTLVTARLARRFEEGVRAAGARPLVVLLPEVDDVPSYREGGHPPLRFVAEEAKRLGVDVFDLGPEFFRELDPTNVDDASPLYVGGVGHPNARAAVIIARALAVRLRQ